MSRTAVYTALVLRCRPSGESNSEVTLLTAEEGIIKATVFGGPKSKLRAHSAQYNSGRVWIYRDKSKDYAKLSDFDVQSWRAGLRELYERTMTASAVAETILSSHGGGGGWTTALDLALDTLDALENADEALCPFLLVHFLWRWTGFLGIQPHLDSCSECGKDADDSIVFYNTREGSVICSDCSIHTPHSSFNTQHSSFLTLNPGCRKWLSAVSEIEPAQLYRFSMDKKSFNEVKSFVTAVLSETLGNSRINAWMKDLV